MERLTAARQSDHYLHTASHRVIDFLVTTGTEALVIGKSPRWKQEVNLGRHGHHNRVSIPYGHFIEMLTYKADWGM
jgi:putative transposase